MKNFNMEQLARIRCFDGYRNPLPQISELNDVWDRAHYVVIPDEAAFMALRDYVDGNELLESTMRPHRPGWFQLVLDEDYLPSYWRQLGGDAEVIHSMARSLGMDLADAFLQLCR